MSEKYYFAILQPCRYHVLIYGAEEQNPEWLQPSSPEYGDWTPEEKRQIIIDHVTEVVTMYRGRIKYYDVVNEAICDCVGWPGKHCLEDFFVVHSKLSVFVIE